MAAALSVLVPLRAKDFAFYRERLALRDAIDLSGIETIIIDDGSAGSVAAEIAAFCADRGYGYVRLETADRPFSLARARNAGLRVASGSMVYMDDADLVYRHAFFQEVAAQLRGMFSTPFNFLCLPTAYLTEEATAKIFSEGCLDASYVEVMHALLLEDPKGAPSNAVIESYAPASGVVALSRELALDIGGYDEAFSGWGGEDRDFIFRLLCVNQKIRLPAEFNETKSWSMNDTLAFRGWRALQRLHGEFMARQGLYAVHLYHKKLPWRRPVATALNMRLAAGKARAVPVVDLASPGRRDIRSSVLFDVYRAHDLLDEEVDSRVLMERLGAENRRKARAQSRVRVVQRRLRQLLVSVALFFTGARRGLPRRLVRFFRL